MSLISFSITLHVMFSVIWVGGMFFAYSFLRPVAAGQLEPPVRLRFWVAIFSRFFPFVWLSIIILPLTGFHIGHVIWRGFANAPVHVHIMAGIAGVMILIFLHVFFAPFKRLKQAIIIEDWPTGGKQLNQIRQLIRINLVLGLIVITVATFSRYNLMVPTS